MVLTLTMLMTLEGVLFVVVSALEERMGTEALRPYETWILMSGLFAVVISALLGDQLWGRLFVKSGYLSPEAVIRIRTNRAPTAKGEKIHRRISLSLSILIPIFLVGVGWYLNSWWMMGLAALVGIWLSVSVWAGWKKADAMIAGTESLPSEFKGVADDLDNLKNSDKTEKPEHSDNG